MNKIECSNKQYLRGGHEFFMIEVVYDIQLHRKKREDFKRKIKSQTDTAPCLILGK
jgi:hypothetical protein